MSTQGFIFSCRGMYSYDLNVVSAATVDISININVNVKCKNDVGDNLNPEAAPSP